MQVIAQTDRFLIRNFKPIEENLFLSLFNDDEVTLHLPKRTKVENLEIFKETIENYAKRQVLGRWGIFDQSNEDFIGMCLLRDYNGDADKVEIGYVLTKKYWGKGIAGDMAKAIVNYAITNIKSADIVAVTTLENYASQKVLEKAGLKRMDNILKDGRELTFFRFE